MTRVVVDAAALGELKAKLVQATQDAQEASQKAKQTMADIQGAWEGKAAEKYQSLMEEIGPKMDEAAKIYEEVGERVSKFVDAIIETDGAF